MVWVAGVLFVILLFLFPKKMGVLIGSVVAIAVVIGLGAWGYDALEISRVNSVVVTADYEPDLCPEGFPLNIFFQNNAGKTVSQVDWYLEAYKPGYSNNVIDSSSSYRRYSSDKILAPGDRHLLCYQSPNLKEGIEADEVEWKVSSKHVDFD